MGKLSLAQVVDVPEHNTRDVPAILRNDHILQVHVTSETQESIDAWLDELGITRVKRAAIQAMLQQTTKAVLEGEMNLTLAELYGRIEAQITEHIDAANKFGVRIGRKR